MNKKMIYYNDYTDIIIQYILFTIITKLQENKYNYDYREINT